jgi:hypothetical protein
MIDGGGPDNPMVHSNRGGDGTMVWVDSKDGDCNV